MVRTMQISGPGSKTASQLNPSASVGAAGGAPATTQPVRQEAASDQVQLSSLSKYFASALEGSPAHVANVNQLSVAVSAGQYHVDAYAVSGSIIQYSIEFGGSGYLGMST